MTRIVPTLMILAALSTSMHLSAQDATSPPGGAMRSSSSSSSVRIGGKVGAHYLIGSMKLQPTPKNPPTNPKGLGMQFGAYAEIPFSDMVGLRPELAFSFRRMKSEVTTNKSYAAGDQATYNGQLFVGTVDTLQEIDQRLTYFQLNAPLMITPAEGFRVMFGPSFNFLMGGKQSVDQTVTIKGTAGNQSVNDETFATSTKKGSTAIKNFRKADVAVMAGLGYTLDVGFDMDLRYYRGLSTTFDESQGSARTRVWTNMIEFSLGWTFGG